MPVRGQTVTRNLKPQKVDDLQKMLPYLPKEHRSFYENIRQHDENSSDSEYDD
jgi:hypothetical protein